MSALQYASSRLNSQMLFWGIILAAWVLAILMTITGEEWILNHDILIEESSLSWLATLFVFVAAWQLMTAGMMLPSSLPLMRLYNRASKNQSKPGLLNVALLAGYFAVWTGFAVVAYVGDTGLHALTDRWLWLDERGWLIAGPTLIVAGAFQFSELKERCLTECRSPQGFLWRHYGRGPRAALRLGLRHGIFCLGCCWALMLIMFGLGVGNLAWMVGVGSVMIIEKTSRNGHKIMPVVGAALLIWGVLVLLQPGWLPMPLGGSLSG